MPEPILYLQAAGAADLLPMQRPELAPLRTIGVTQGGIYELSRRFRLGRPAHPYHFHLLPLAGTVRYRVHEGGVERTGTVSPGQVWQCPQPIPYEVWSDGPGRMLWWSLLPDATLAPLASARLLRPRPLAARIPVLLGWILEDHAGQHRLAAPRTMRAQAELLAVAVRRVSSDERDPRAVDDRRSLRPLWQAVIARPELPWTLDDLARRCGMDRFRLIRLMRAAYGCTPMAMVAQLRLQRAEELLADGGRTLAAIAAEVGYGSGFALSKAFRRLTGLSPAEFRRRARPEPPAARR